MSRYLLDTNKRNKRRKDMAMESILVRPRTAGNAAPERDDKEAAPGKKQAEGPGAPWALGDLARRIMEEDDALLRALARR